MTPEGRAGLQPERTALAWHRTGLAHMTAGAVLLHVLPRSPVRPVLAAVLVSIGVTAAWAGARDHDVHGRRRAVWLRALTGGTVLAAIAAVAASLA